MLTKAGFANPDAQILSQPATFPNRTAFTGFVKQWFPYLRAVPDAQKERFLNEIVEAYLNKSPAGSEGQVLFPLEVLQVRATKA